VTLSESELIIGIDLGTTNCACAVMHNGVPVMIPNSLGHNLTPSAVSLDEKGMVLTGLAARERQSTHANQTATAYKRFMGTDRQIQLGEKMFRAEELSAFVLAGIKRDAEAFLGETVTEAVITVPAYFNNKQRTATRNAGELAGLKVERLINEPTAAALAYGLNQKEIETKFLVFDLGGGTFDVSILELFDGIIEVRASSGDNRLGGEDFNAALISLASTRLDPEIGADVKVSTVLRQKLREAAERTRRALTSSHEAPFALVWKDKEHSCKVTADDLEAACADLIARLREPIIRSMRDTDLRAEDLTEIVLVGGSTRMGIVRKAVTKMFGRFPNMSVDPDEAIARGAAVQAGLKARDAALSEVVLTDVCPFSLGTTTSEKTPSNEFIFGIFSPIIERNCVVPASREHVFVTASDNQTQVTFPIYQGESRWVRDNVYLGEVDVPVPRAKAGKVDITCRFSYDINGILEVDLHVPETGTRRQLVIADKDAIAPAEIASRRKALEALKIHPRDTDAIKSTLGRAGRCYENAIGDRRIWIGHVISQFEAVLIKQDPRQCEAARIELEAALDGLEGPSFL
jgi:molecular chaperone HscC